jgi:predicted GIY-YIG superfamily endonuclease
MPRTAIDYSKSMIYKIEHQDKPELIYVGSTTDFTRRKNNHKSKCNNSNNKSYNLKLYQMIRSNGGWESFKIIIIKELNCKNKVELLLEEDRMMKEMKANLNSCRAHPSDQEKFESKKESDKNYRENNYESINKKCSCDCGGKFTFKHKSVHEKTKKHLKYLEQLQPDILDV